MILSSYSVRGTLLAYDITALRFGVAGLVLLPVLIKKGLRIGPYGVLGGLLLAAMMGAPYNTIAIMGMKYAPVSHAAGIINTTLLCITTLIGIYFLREKTSGIKLAGIALSIIGIACLLDAKGNDGEDTFFGHMLFLIAGCMWAVYTISMKAWKVDALHAAAAVCCFSGIFYLPIYFAFLPSNLGMHNIGEATFQALYQGLLNSIFALICYNRGVALLGASTSSAFLPLVPVISTLLAIPFLAQIPSTLEWTGIILCATGVLLSSGILRDRKV